ncbi:MAG TPA: PilX N-terminal domain-containing pilus assembly protein [Candidatus Angelobacter sp.]|jgi:Tfp pilus assembly protein PilX|nr:PilX N-terminal domain-containing pilus assembly protein [Candidatus Angelobacter sp.]
MQRENSKFKQRSRASKDQRGVALITTLLLLMLLTGLTLAMAWSSRSDMLINGYYRNFRGSFYAADSGVNIMRQAMTPLFLPGGALYPTNFVVGTNPLPKKATEDAVMAAINGPYGAGTISGSGNGTSGKSWPGKYTGNITFTERSCSTNLGSTCTPFPANATTVNYTYAYTITATGTSLGAEKTNLVDSGLVMITASIPTPAQLNFAGYGMFIDQYNVCDGTTLVPGTITGPVFTNGSWNFGTGQYTFTDQLGQAGPTVGTSTGCPTGATTLPANVSAPQGFKPGQQKVKLPANSFNQQSAVLDGKGANPDGTPRSQPTSSDMNKVLKKIDKSAYPSGGASSGVFLPYTVDSSGKASFTGGGIMVEGNASVTLSPTATGKGQIYTITNGLPSVTTTITIDPVSNTTVVSSGSTTLNISGVPHQFDPTAGTDLGYDTMLYVDGNITSLSGPGQGKPAIQDGNALTITAANNVTITGDLLYKNEPVYGAPSNPATAAHPIDTLTGNDSGQALGIFTASGDIQLKNGQANGNLEIDASMATISAAGTGGLTNIGNQIQTLTIVGGRIQNNIKNINAVQRNVLFDQRFANDFAPPWFPSTGIAKGTNGANLNKPVVTRLQWLNQNNYF